MPPTRTASAPSASRTSILFPPGTTFRSAEDFVKQTHSRLAAEYGSGSRAPTKAGDALVIKCVPRQKIGCPFRVVAKEGRGKWQLVDAECRWYHDHGADGPVAKKKEQASIAQHAAPKGKGATLVGPTSRATPHNISRSPTKTKAKGQRSAYERVVLKQWPTPDLPRPGDRFPSSDAFMVAATIGVVPVYGTGIWKYGVTTPTSLTLACSKAHDTGCPFLLRAVRGSTGQWTVEERDYRARHNHAPRPEILADPAWRPQLKSATGVRALAELAKRAQHPPSGLPKRTTTPSLSPPPVNNDEEKMSPLPFAMPSGAKSAPPIPSTSSHSASSTSRTQRESSPFPLPSSYNINLSFLPALTSFLIGLNPTLESLAPHLLVAGVDSLSRLVQLSELDAFGLDAFLDAIAQNREALQAGGEGMAPATMLQLKMLRKGLLDSKAG